MCNNNKQKYKTKTNKQTSDRQINKHSSSSCCRQQATRVASSWHATIPAASLSLSLPAHLTLGCHWLHFCRIPFRVATRQVLLSQLVSVATVCGRQLSTAQLSLAPIFNLQLEPESEPSSPITKLTLSQFQSCQHNWGHLHVPNSQKKQVATATTTRTTTQARNWEWQ